MEYVYSFVVWPDETWDHPPALFEYFRVFRRRTEVYKTQEDFERFRSEMSHAGLTLREITRRPGVKSEPVD